MHLLKLALIVRKEDRLFWAYFKVNDLARFWYLLDGGTYFFFYSRFATCYNDKSCQSYHTFRFVVDHFLLRTDVVM